LLKPNFIGTLCQGYIVDFLCGQDEYERILARLT
jgi:hypothetical protein